MLSFLGKHWFLLGVIVVISLAKAVPWVGSKEGPLLPEITVRYVAVSTIFFFNGLQLKTEVVLKALSEVKVHAFIQVYTFVAIPFILKVIVMFLNFLGAMDKLLLEGLTVLSCMPPPVSSAVILATAALSQVGGGGTTSDNSDVQASVASAVFNSVFGSFMGIVISPVLMLTLVGMSSTLPFMSIIIKLSCTVVMPLLVGQVVRYFIKSYLEAMKIPFSQISSGILLLIIYTTFCDTFLHADISISPSSLVVLVLVVIAFQCTLLGIVNVLASRALGFSKTMVVTMMFCSTHKSLTLGIPMLKIVFAGDPGLSIISIPLLVYHPTQILLGALLVPFLQSWVCSSPPTSDEEA
jgi:sodium/bile acid cotransporter 7